MEFYARPDGDCGKLEIDRRGRGTDVKMEIYISAIITLATNVRLLMDKVCRSTTMKNSNGITGGVLLKADGFITCPFLKLK